MVLPHLELTLRPSVPGEVSEELPVHEWMHIADRCAGYGAAPSRLIGPVCHETKGEGEITE